MATDFLGLPGTELRHFEESMLFDLGRWRDGEGLDLDVLRAMTPGERGLIEPKLKGSTEWRIVEALAELKRLNGATSPEKTAELVEALGTKSGEDGLLETLAQVRAYHPAEVVAALWRGVRYRSGADAIAFAEAILFLHGRTGPSPEFLQDFHGPDSTTRARGLFALAREVGIAI